MGGRPRRPLKVVFQAYYDPQIGEPPAPGQDFDGNAAAFVRAAASGDCDSFWRLLHPASRFVRAREGDKAKLCADLAEAYKSEPKESSLADLAQNKDAKPEKLGVTRDIGLYGLGLPSGRYMAFFLSTKLEGLPARLQQGHDHPAVMDYLSLARPSG